MGSRMWKIVQLPSVVQKLVELMIMMVAIQRDRVETKTRLTSALIATRNSMSEQMRRSRKTVNDETWNGRLTHPAKGNNTWMSVGVCTVWV